MPEPNRHRLKYVLDQIPAGFLVDSRWFAANDVSKSSVHDYHRQGWLEKLARGVYRRPYPNANAQDVSAWKMPVLSAQWIMGYDFHIGGMSALALRGHSHYVTFKPRKEIHVYGGVPNWLPKLNIASHFVLRRRRLFGSALLGIDNQDFDPSADKAPGPWDWPLRCSTPERAILEALDELPEGESFHMVDMIFEGMVVTRPALLNALLQACSSVKVKRLFLLFADRHSHQWLRRIDRGAIDLGKGPRSLVEGGRYLAAYQLVVPDEFVSLKYDGYTITADMP